ncbi:MAG TPA: bifunctional 4-hydroxy-2-oxoglutarate aldolase/2-dehydro-3-deoxy-phosphogluconate aldolase [Salinarimonas sp.]|nr:bifunctional 4-hydroxy-2-oxoglutarate aldolase/2-dehydro-3-deoxy-phosphogluconate aldolase [Salinarimonas sp.]
MPRDLSALLARAPVIPVIALDDAGLAEPLARTLVEAGLPLIEITLRTPQALDAIRAVARAVPDAVPIAGTVLDERGIAEAMEAGAQGVVTPGTPPALAEALARADVPALPGCATASEAMALSGLGFRQLKFFPAEASGGARWLAAIAGPLPHLAFCPTGGITPGNAADYLALANVPCVGGTWIAPKAALAARDFAAIGRLAREAAALRRG